MGRALLALFGMIAAVALLALGGLRLEIPVALHEESEAWDLAEYLDFYPHDPISERGLIVNTTFGGVAFGSATIGEVLMRFPRFTYDSTQPMLEGPPPCPT